MSSSQESRTRTLVKHVVSSTKRSRRRLTGREYRYDELSTQGSYFRTLILQPGADNEPLRCSLQTSTLENTSFEAISYVWGSSIRDKEIACGDRVVAIPTSLWTCLRHIRSDHARVLWADSICINQDDAKEKEHQVAMMGQIYRAAEQVLIFLGADDAGHGDNVCSLLKDTQEIIKRGLEAASTLPGAFPWPKGGEPILSDTRWRSFNHMLKQSWFDRGWVRLSPTHCRLKATNIVTQGCARSSSRQKLPIDLGPAGAQLGACNANLCVDSLASTFSSPDSAFSNTCTLDTLPTLSPILCENLPQERREI